MYAFYDNCGMGEEGSRHWRGRIRVGRYLPPRDESFAFPKFWLNYQHYEFVDSDSACSVTWALGTEIPLSSDLHAQKKIARRGLRYCCVLRGSSPRRRSSEDMAAPFPIGTPGQPWGDAEKEEWRATRKVQRSYKDEVIDKLQQLDADVFDVVQ